MANIMQYLIQMSDEARGYYEDILIKNKELAIHIDELKARVIELESTVSRIRED